MCVRVCEREREREKVCVYVCVRDTLTHRHPYIFYIYDENTMGWLQLIIHIYLKIIEKNRFFFWFFLHQIAPIKGFLLYFFYINSRRYYMTSSHMSQLLERRKQICHISSPPQEEEFQSCGDASTHERRAQELCRWWFMVSYPLRGIDVEKAHLTMSI